MTRGRLTDNQRDTLLRPIMPQRVSTANGMSHVEGYEIVAHLTRLFGFEGWDKYVTDLTELFEESGPSRDGKKTVWTVAYRATVRIEVFDTDGNLVTVKEDSSGGSAQNQPSRADAHDLALKSAITTAMKRAAKDLGDQFGLSLYKRGSMDALVVKVAAYGDAPRSAVQDSIINSDDPQLGLE